MSHVFDLKQSVTELDGYRIHGFEGDYIFFGIKNSGQYYEKDTLKKWMPLLGNVKTVLDVGANLGNHTLYWAKYLQPEKIVSFEPFPVNYEVLQRNISDNGLDQIVTAEMLAVGDSSGYVSVASVDVDNLGATSFKRADGQSVNADFDATEMTSVDRYVQQHQLIVDFIKIDTEGFELSVLKGAVKTIERDKPALWIEVSETSHAIVSEYLEHLGYRMIDVIGFNLLFLHQTKTDQKPLFDMAKIMDMMFLYQSKTNTYYANYIKVKKWLATEREKSQRATESYEAAEKWLAAEKEKSQRATESYETIKKWLAAEKEKLQRATENYENVKKWLTKEQKARASAEMQFLQLQFLMQQREEESYNIQRALTQRIIKTDKDLREENQKLAKTENDLKKKNQKLLKTENDLKKKTLPSIWYTMAGSRVGRTLCRLFRWYHESKRLFR